MKFLIVPLDDEVYAGLVMLRVDCARADPGAQWTDETIAASMLEQIIADDLALAERPVLVN